MGIGIEIGSAVGNIAGSMGKVGGAPAAVAGLEARFGPVMGTADIRPMVNGGPVGMPLFVNEGPAASLKGFEHMGINDRGILDLKGGSYHPSFDLEGEISFNSQPQVWEAVPAEPETIASIEDFLAQAREKPQLEQTPLIKEAAIEPVKQATYWFVDVPESQRVVKPAEIIMPQVEPMAVPWALPETQPALEVQPKLQPVTEVRVSNQTAQFVAVQPVLEEQEEETEELVKEEVIRDEAGTEEEEKIEKVIKKHVVDDHALSQVVSEVKGALVKAQELAKKLGLKLTGVLVGKFVPGQHPGNESEAVKGKGPDGSIPERRQSIEELGELLDVAAEEKLVKVVYGKPPIKIRPEGTQVKDEDVQRVYKDHRIKPKAIAVTEVITRIIKKKKLAGQLGQKPVEVPIQTGVSGNRIEDHPQLDGVFQKAA